ncbi:MAG: translation initiation factor IF-2 N-terminal domain-containing protein, partial [Clostridiales bacterium]|nr:translation initiation factor IF-2 N-terminal domain-containing protein [Candidatus Equinaster intestinalis]
MVKYKITDAAKDFNITSKELVAILESKTGEAKKTTASLADAEVDILFAVMTDAYSVKSFDEYFATGETARKDAAEKRKADKDKKLAEQMAILEQLKAAAEAEEKAKKEAAKAAKQPKKAEPKAEEKPKTAKKAEPKAEEKPEPKKVIDEPLVAPPKKQKVGGAAPNRGPAQIRHVDTRTVQVDMDKYNEKYENIAPANSMKDNYSRKQKIKQKSQDYRRPQGVKRETEADKLRRMQLEKIKKTPITVTVGEETTVGELAAALKKTAADVIKELMKLGMMATVNQVIDYDTAEIVVTEMGAKIEKAVVVTIEEQIM